MKRVLQESNLALVTKLWGEIGKVVKPRGPSDPHWRTWSEVLGNEDAMFNDNRDEEIITIASRILLEPEPEEDY